MIYNINISSRAPGRVYGGLLLAGFLITAAYIFLSIIIKKPAQTFNLDSEANIPAWFAAAQYLLLAALLLSGNMHRNMIRKSTGKFIRLAGLIFIFMSMDEAAGLHEALGNLLERAAWNPVVMGKSGSWTLIYAAIAVAILVWGRKAVYELYVSFKSEARLAIAGMLLLVTGAIAFEMIGKLLPRNTDLDLIYKAEVILEEYFEMLGVSTLIFSALKVLQRKQKMETEAIGDEIAAEYKIIEEKNLHRSPAF